METQNKQKKDTNDSNAVLPRFLVHCTQVNAHGWGLKRVAWGETKGKDAFIPWEQKAARVERRNAHITSSIFWSQELVDKTKHCYHHRDLRLLLLQQLGTCREDTRSPSTWGGRRKAVKYTQRRKIKVSASTLRKTLVEGTGLLPLQRFPIGASDAGENTPTFQNNIHRGGFIVNFPKSQGQNCLENALRPHWDRL